MLTEANGEDSRATSDLDEQCYRHLLESIEQGFSLIELIHDSAGRAVDYRFLKTNQAFERQTGLMNVIGKTALEVVPDLEPQWVETYARVAQTGEPFAFEQGSLAMGRVFRIEAVGLDGTGSQKVALIFSDITESRRSEQRLIKKAESLRLALEAAEMGVWDWNFETGENTWNDAMYLMLGLKPNAVPASYETWIGRVHPADLVALEIRFAESLRFDGEFRAEYRVLGPHDTVRWVAARGRTASDTKGKIIRSYGVVTDVSARKIINQDLRISETRYRRLFECAHDGVIILDSGTRRIIDANPFMTNLLGYETAELVGKELYEIGLLKDDAASRSMIEDLKRNNQVRYDNLPLESRTGRHQEVEVIANLYDEGNRPVIQCNIRDITERKRSEEHLKMLMAEVNHRAKNLLAVVQAIANQTAKEGLPETFSARLSARIVALAAGQDLLVRNQWQGVQLSELVAAQLDHFRDWIGTRVLLSGPSVEMQPDAAQGIGMALHELGTNAAKYGALSNGEGKVFINWEVDDVPVPTFSMSWVERGGPKVITPVRLGFGQTVIGRMAKAAVQGDAGISFAEEGLRWSLSAPAENVLTRSNLARS